MRFIDPDGMGPTDQYFGANGKLLGVDENGDNGRVRIVTDKASIATIKANTAAGNITNSSTVTTAVSTTKTVLKEALNVLTRTNDNGGKKEENSTVTSNGTVKVGAQGSEETTVINKQNTATASIEVPSGTDNTSIHSHRTYTSPMNSDGSIDDAGGDAGTPGPKDPDTFKSFSENIIVGNLGIPTVTSDGLGNHTEHSPEQGAVFYDSKSNKQATVTKDAVTKIANSQ